MRYNKSFGLLITILMLILLLPLSLYTGLMTKNISVSVVSATIDCLFFTSTPLEIIRNQAGYFEVYNRNCGNQNFTGNTTINIIDSGLSTVFSDTSSNFSLGPVELLKFSASWSSSSITPLGVYQANAKTYYNGFVAEVNRTFFVSRGGIINFIADTLNETVINFSDQLEVFKEEGSVIINFIILTEDINRTHLDYCKDNQTYAGTPVNCTGLDLKRGVLYNYSEIYTNSSILVIFANMTPIPSPPTPPTPPPTPTPTPSPGSSRTILTTTQKIMSLDAVLPENVLPAYMGRPLLFEVHVNNTGDVDIEDLKILPEIPSGWTSVGKTIEMLKVNETASVVISITPSLDAEPVITFINVSFITKGRLILKKSVVLDFPLAPPKDILKITEYPRSLQLLINSKDRIPIVIENQGTLSLGNLITKLENHESCFSITGNNIQAIENLPPGESWSLEWNILVSSEITTCNVTITTSSGEGVSASETIKVSVVDEIDDIYPFVSVRLPGFLNITASPLALFLLIVIILVLLLKLKTSRRKKEAKQLLLIKRKLREKPASKKENQEKIPASKKDSEKKANKKENQEKTQQAKEKTNN